MGDVYRVVAPPPLIFLGLLALGILADELLTDAGVANGLAVPLGAVLVALGLGLNASFLRLFRRADTAILPGHEGSALVTGGVYRFSRNPGYVGMALAAAGIAMLADAPWALVAVAIAVAVVDRGVIVREEAYLRERFGEEYRAYCARVRRWI